MQDILDIVAAKVGISNVEDVVARLPLVVV